MGKAVSRRLRLLVLSGAIFTYFVYPLCSALSQTPATTRGVTPAAGNPDSILAAMDRAAARLHTVEAKFVADQYQAVVDVHSKQSGTMLLRKTRKGITLGIEVTSPQKQSVLIDGKTVRIVQPNINRNRSYNLSRYRDAFATLTAVRLGSSGQDVLQQFQVEYAGTEAVDGVITHKILLKPKSASVRRTFDLIVLWIDPDLGISRQQQLFEPGDPKARDYRLTTYSNIKIY